MVLAVVNCRPGTPCCRSTIRNSPDAKRASRCANYNNIHAGIVELLKTARSAAARNVNSIMTATYWEIGRRIVMFEQAGEHRAEYGEKLIEQAAVSKRGSVM